jgi:hypothetical protein
MNQLKIFCLNNPAEIFTTYASAPDLVSFLERTRRVNIFSILAVKGPRSLFIEKITNEAELIKSLTTFNTLP